MTFRSNLLYPSALAGAERVSHWSRPLAVGAAILPMLALAGHLFGLPRLVTLLPGLTGMSPVTALALIALALGVLWQSGSETRKTKFAAAFAALLAAAVGASYAAYGADRLSTFVVSAIAIGGAPVYVSVATATALCLLLLSVSLAVGKALPHVSASASSLSLFVSGAAILGYAYGVEDLYALAGFKTLALHTAISLFLLSSATILEAPWAIWKGVLVSDTEAGRSTRRQLWFAAVPALAGWLLLKLTGDGGLGIGVAMALLVILMVAPLVVLVIRDGSRLEALELERAAKNEVETQAARRMEEKLAEQAAQIAAQADEAAQAQASVYRSQKLETVGQLTGGIAHDFNNLLMTISGNLQLLKRKLQAEDPSLRYVEKASEAVDKGARLNNQLLTFSRSQRLDLKPVEVDAVVATARTVAAQTLGTDVDLTFDDQVGVAWVRTDRAQVDQALLNLLLNARDAMAPGGVVSIRVQRREERLNQGAVTGFIVFEVTDNGAGMTPEVAARAFEPFFTTKEQGRGTGLGLSQVYGFAQQSGGTARIRSAALAGTTVEILLPEAWPAQARAEGSSAVGGSTGRAKQILVVDDDDGVRGVIVDSLRDSGLEITEASNGADALSRLAQWRPDAAVIDFLMPGMNGAELARKAQGRWPALPIIFVSGYSDTLALDGVAGATVIRKPFQMDELQRRLEEITR